MINRNRKRYIAFLVALFYLCSMVARPRANENKIERYRQATLQKITKHKVKHSDCILFSFYDKIQTIDIVFFNGDKHTSAYFYEGKIYLNKNFWRTEKDVVITILHEIVHAYAICGVDIYKTTSSICYLFDKPVYYSTDITKHIEDHLKDY